MKKILWLMCLSGSLSASFFGDFNTSQNQNNKSLSNTVLSKILVKGESLLQKPADQMSLSVGVVTQAETAAQALLENNQKMNAVIKALEKSGLTKKDYQTGRISIQPIWSHQPKGADENFRSSIISYSVTNSVNVKTGQLDKAAEIIDAAGKAGANTVDNIVFDIKDSRAFRAESIRTATEFAIADAKEIAAVTGQKLVRLLEASLDEARPNPIFSQPRAMSFAKMGGSGDGLPLNAGEVEISAAVMLVYEVAPQ